MPMSDNKKQFDFAAGWKTYILIPVCILAAAIIFSIIFKIDVAIEFSGGTMLTYSYEGEINVNEVESLVEDAGYGSVGVTTGSSFGSDLKTVIISFASNEGLTADVQATVSASLIENFAENRLELINSQDVNPSTGASFFVKCMVAVAFSFVLLVIYIAFRFKKIGGWSAGVFALVALMVDIAMVISSFAFFRLEIDANFIAVILTILGYSLNNTIVIYDRIRENRSLYGKKLTHRELVNTSIKQSLTRAVNTTVATGLAVVVICIVSAIYGVNSIVSFAFPMLIGLLSGVYTSIFFLGPMWVAWQEYKIKSGKTVKA